MYTILEKVESLLEIEKSKFFAIAGHIDSSDEFKFILSLIKKEYPGAKHYCYAYITNGQSKSSDDGEPSGTAGRPLLTLLTNKNLSNSYIIVVRYFGGIKLGASRLLRTYVDAANLAISKSKIGEYKTLLSSHIDNLSYDQFYLLQNFCNSHNLLLENVIYSNNINVDIISNEDITSTINALFKGVVKIISKNEITKVVEVN